MKQLHKKFEHWVFNAYSCDSYQLGVYRIIFMFLLIFIVGVPEFSSKISLFPDGYFNPPPFFSLFFDEVLPLIYFRITDTLITIGFFFVFIGFFTKVSGIILAFLCIINYGFIYSTGKIDHSFIIWFTLFMMSFTGWGKTFSLDNIVNNTEKIKIQEWPISLIAMGLGFSFFTSGLIKLISGWLEFSESMVRAFYLRNYYIQQKQDYLARFFEHFNFDLFWESGDWFTVIFEIGFLLVVFRPVLFRFFTLLANFFHGMVMLMFNISFHFLPVYLLFWTPIIPSEKIKQLNSIFDELKLNKFKLISVLAFILLIYILHLSTINNINLALKDLFLLIAFLLSIYILFKKPKLSFINTLDKKGKNIIEFDGVCNLCNGFIQFVIKRDKGAYFKFAPLQVIQPGKKDYETIILRQKSDTFDKSTAFLEIVRKLDGLWPYLYLLVLVPKFCRDSIYSIIARNRYLWFGKKDICMVPTPELKNRFIE